MSYNLCLPGRRNGGMTIAYIGVVCAQPAVPQETSANLKISGKLLCRAAGQFPADFRANRCRQPARCEQIPDVTFPSQ